MLQVLDIIFWHYICVMICGSPVIHSPAGTNVMRKLLLSTALVIAALARPALATPVLTVTGVLIQGDIVTIAGPTSSETVYAGPLTPAASLARHWPCHGPAGVRRNADLHHGRPKSQRGCGCAGADYPGVVVRWPRPAQCHSAAPRRSQSRLESFEGQSFSHSNMLCFEAGTRKVGPRAL